MRGWQNVSVTLALRTWRLRPGSRLGHLRPHWFPSRRSCPCVPRGKAYTCTIIQIRDMLDWFQRPLLHFAIEPQTAKEARLRWRSKIASPELRAFCAIEMRASSDYPVWLLRRQEPLQRHLLLLYYPTGRCFYELLSSLPG